MKQLTISLIIITALVLGLSQYTLADSPTSSEAEVALTALSEVGSKISYQGQLTDKNTGQPMNGQLDMTFRLYDAASGGKQLGPDMVKNKVVVSKGLFSVVLNVVVEDFAEVFSGQGLWLQVTVGNETLSPRHEILPVPYALGLKPGTDVVGNITDASALAVMNDGNGNGLYARTSSKGKYHAAVQGQADNEKSFGVQGTSKKYIGVHGWSDNPENTHPTVQGNNQGGGPGVRGESKVSYGVEGKSDAGHGVYGTTDSKGNWQAGVRGYSIHDKTYGVLGYSENGYAVGGDIFNSDNTNPAVNGDNNGGGPGVRGESKVSYGVRGHSDASHGVKGTTNGTEGDYDAGVYGYAENEKDYGVEGVSEKYIGVNGYSNNPENTNPAVRGDNAGGGDGVQGYSKTGYGIRGETEGMDGDYDAGVYGRAENELDYGVYGYSKQFIGVNGYSDDADNAYPAVRGYNAGGGEGVYGYSKNDDGVRGHSDGNDGVKGSTDSAAGFDAGVKGYSKNGKNFGVEGISQNYIGIQGWSDNPDNSYPAIQGNNQGGGIGVSGLSKTNYGVFGDGKEYGVAAPDGMLAPKFDVGNADLAEYLPAASTLTAGDVVVIAEQATNGYGLELSHEAYDTAVAGIISTEPGLTLGVKDGQIMGGDNHDDVPLALAGRVPCKVDAAPGAIHVGDLLTTSTTPGHAMRCANRLDCVGAIIGKALEPLEDGQGTITVLVGLQ